MKSTSIGAPQTMVIPQYNEVKAGISYFPLTWSMNFLDRVMTVGGWILKMNVMIQRVSHSAKSTLSIV
jgi:hypothetical protein